MFSYAFAIVVMWILGKHLNNMGLFFLAIAIECSIFFVAVGIADGSSDVTISFWYSLFDALNLIT